MDARGRSGARRLTRSSTRTCRGLGALQQVNSLVDGYAFTWTYDAAGQATAMASPVNGVAELREYDGAGRLTHRKLTGSQYINPIGTQPQTIHDDTLRYNFRGRLDATHSIRDTVLMRYSGLGHVDSMITYLRGFSDVKEERFETDPLGNTKWMDWLDPSSNTIVRRGFVFDVATGRQTAMTHETNTGQQTQTEYDSAGNVARTWSAQLAPRVGQGGLQVTNVSRMYYDALGRLRVLDKRTVEAATSLPGVPASYLGSYEEYRYDPFGRRIWKWARRYDCEGMCLSHIERYQWDGDQLAMEIRMPAPITLPLDSLERDAGFTSVAAAWAAIPAAASGYDLLAPLWPSGLHERTESGSTAADSPAVVRPE